MLVTLLSVSVWCHKDSGEGQSGPFSVTSAGKKLDDPIVVPHPFLPNSNNNAGSEGAIWNPNDYVTSLGGGKFPYYCDLTPLVVNNAEYEKRCGIGSDPKWPCFTHWHGNLGFIKAMPWLEPLNLTEEILVKDNNAVGT